MGRSDPAVYSFYTRYVTRRLDLSLVRTAAYLGWQAVPSFMRKYPFASCCYDVVNEDGTREPAIGTSTEIAGISRATISSWSTALRYSPSPSDCCSKSWPISSSNKCVVCDFITGARVCGNIALLTHYREILSGPVNIVDLSGTHLEPQHLRQAAEQRGRNVPPSSGFLRGLQILLQKREVAKTLPWSATRMSCSRREKWSGRLQMTSIEMVRLPAQGATRTSWFWVF